jgi:hypothetical protein
MRDKNLKTLILLVDDDPRKYVVNFTDDLESEFEVNVFHEDNFENVLELLDTLKNDLKIIILDIMARKHEFLYGKPTKEGFNAGLVLLELIEEKLEKEGWRNQVSICFRSARQDLSYQNTTLKNKPFFRREENDEIKNFIREILKT